MMKPAVITIAITVLTACAIGDTDTPIATVATWTDLSEIAKPDAITQTPWAEVVIGVQSFADVPRLFTDIGGFETVTRTDADWVLRAVGSDSGYVRFKRVSDNAVPTRPFDSRSWDTGCYFSVMMRAKDLPTIITDAKALGWTPLTDMAYLEFGPSQLNIVVLGHQKTGIQVQLYERLTTPLPDGFTPFDRLSRPFNIMQIVDSRDTAYRFFRQGLGFDDFYFGRPTVSKTPEISPIGIPENMTTSVAYHAGITTPQSGLEWGRMEMIQVDMKNGKDLSKQCLHGNIGITEVRFDVDSLDNTASKFDARNIPFERDGTRLRVKTPDGANITFQTPSNTP